MPYIDTHAHLDQEEFDVDRDAVVARSRLAGVETIVCVGISADSSQATLAFAETYPHVYAAVGIQPNYCAGAAAGDWERIVEMTNRPRVVALGETGLDRHWDLAPFDLQQESFDRHLRLAQQRDLPVIVHCREAAADLLPMLREAAARAPLRGVLHAFSGDAAMAAECLELGFHVSFA
ncbi:MAG: hydrolase TatD, partial [Planctomycetes bacterium RBG_13_63_9]